MDPNSEHKLCGMDLLKLDINLGTQVKSKLPSPLRHLNVAMFVSTLTFFKKLMFFRKDFFGKLSHFSIFGSNFKMTWKTIF